MNQISQFISSGRRIQFEHEKTIFFIDYDMNRYFTRKYRTYITSRKSFDSEVTTATLIKTSPILSDIKLTFFAKNVEVNDLICIEM